MKYITAATLLFIFFVPFFGRAQNVNLTVAIEGLHSDLGIVYVSLYNSKEGYPKDAKKAFRLAFSPISGGKCSVLFDGIPAGVYAIACYHDENKNQKLDTKMFGIPAEGTGASNNAKGFMGPPKFSDARFSVSGKMTEEITMHY